MEASFHAAFFRLARTLALVEPSRPTRLIAILRKTARLRAARWSRTRLSGSVRARVNKDRLGWNDEQIRGQAACKMASTVTVRRRNWSLRQSAGTYWL